MDIYAELKKPFDPKLISWRVGATNSDKTKGIALAYIDARDVMNRLDEVFGLDWQCKYTHAGDKTICEIGVRTDRDLWLWRAGGAGNTDVEAEKGAISDAFKRAAVLWGIGRYLYDLPNVWVPIKQQGRSYVLADTPTLPAWANPDGVAAKKPENNRTMTDEAFLGYIAQIEGAGDMASLKDYFGIAFKAANLIGDSVARNKLKAAYDKRKAYFEAEADKDVDM